MPFNFELDFLHLFLFHCLLSFLKTLNSPEKLMVCMSSRMFTFALKSHLILMKFFMVVKFEQCLFLIYTIQCTKHIQHELALLQFFNSFLFGLPLCAVFIAQMEFGCFKCNNKSLISLG